MTNEVNPASDRSAVNASAPSPQDDPTAREHILPYRQRPEAQVPSDRLWREHEQALDLDLRRLLGIFWGHKLLFSAIFLGILLIGCLIIFSIPHKYTARATVLIAPDQISIVDIPELKAPLSTTQEAILSEVEVIKANPMAERVIEAVDFREHLAAPPPQTPTGSLLGAMLPRESLAATQDWASATISMLFDHDAQGATRGEVAEGDEDELSDRKVLQTFYRGLSVEQVGDSHAIRIGFEAVDPVLAAAVVNELAETYVDSQLEADEEARTRAAELLGERLKELRDRVSASDEAITQYRNQSGLVESAGVEPITERISEETVQLVEARAELQRREAQLEELTALQEAGAIEQVQGLVHSASITGLQERAIELRTEIARQSQEFGERHPVIVDLRAELDEVTSRLAGEVSGVVENLRVQADVAAQRVSELESSIAAAKSEISDLNAKQGTLQQLLAEAEVNRSLYETFLTRAQEAEQASFNEADARVLSQGDVPIDPSSPNRRLLFAVALVGAFCISSGVVFGREALNEGFGTEDELTRTLGVPTLAVVPRTSSRRLQTPGGFDRLIANYGSAYTEAIHALHTGLELAKWSGRDPLVIMVTSSAPGEGKSTLVSALARVAGQLGNRVLAIDCDLRRPQLHTCFGLDNDVGITTHVHEADQVDDANDELVAVDPLSGVHVITAGPTDDNPQKILRSQRLTRLLATARDSYDLILIDTPPVLAVVDPVIVASVADGALLVVEWRSTPRRSVQKALSRLRPAGAPVIGSVLSQVKRTMHRSGTYNYLEY